MGTLFSLFKSTRVINGGLKDRHHRLEGPNRNTAIFQEPLI